MRLRTSIVLLAFLILPGVATAQAPTLDSPANVKIGDVGAFFLHNLLEVRRDLSDPTVLTYEAVPGVIDVEIFGTAERVESAKDMVARYWEFIRTAHIPYMQRRFNVVLTERNYRIMYYQRLARTEPKLILSFVNGQYLMAP
jgi:hypothetical protein